ncbi:MAG: restriction endonuclease subunit S [Bacteroidales bacterium]|nr:restriction endonuclease subunit S [Bacteroidales bacterium]
MIKKYEKMENWKEYRIGELVELKQGMAINSQSNHLVSKVETTLPLLRIADMQAQNQVVFMKLETPLRYIAKPEDIIYTRTGQVGLVFKEQYGVVHNNCFRVFPYDEKILSKDYLYWYLKSPSTYKWANTMAAGVAQPDLPHSTFKKLKIQLPPLPTQHRIASILSTYDALIQNYKRQIAALQSAASELYKEWFVRFRFPGYKNAKFNNGLPVGWKVEKLGEIGEIIGGGTPSTEKEEYWNGEIPWLSPADLSDNTNIYVSKGNKNITQLGLAKSSAKMMPKDTVLLSSRAPVGYVALAKNPICTNQGFKSVVCNQSKIKPLYLYFFFKMNTNYLQSIATGATFPELSATMMKKLKVLLPSIKLQEQFVDTISASIIKADLLFDQITNLTTQRDLLLPRLMSGKLSVE